MTDRPSDRSGTQNAYSDAASGKSVTGRPSLYTPELALDILSGMSVGKTLTEICQGEGMPNRATVYRWAEQDAAFRDALARARDAQAHAIAEGGFLRARDAKDAGLDRLAFDGAKWFAAKMAPKVYGEKLDLTAAVDIKDNRSADEIRASIIAMQARLGIKADGEPEGAPGA